MISMVNIEIGRNEAGQRLDRFLKKYLAEAPLSYIYRAIRKDVKVNGRRSPEDAVLKEGDMVTVYISDDKLADFVRKPEHRKVKRQFKTAYEDDNIIAVEKPFGLLTHGDRTEKKNHLANQVIDYLMEEGTYNPRLEKTFTPAPVNRLDRNTTGIVLFGKNAPALQQLNRAIRERKAVGKYYLTITSGEMEKGLVLKDRMVKDGIIGDITRMLVYDGHQGPIEIGCGKDFTTWLTDPVMNGGGAITDFGCYGANLATWLFGGRKPLSVYAVTNSQKPEKYPKVDDDATIILQYPDVTVQLMPSWNWPMNRKDMYVYGSKGYIYQSAPSRMSLYRNGKESDVKPTPLEAPYDDSFRYLKAAVRGEIKVNATDLASLENNLTVVEILDAAVKSARKGKPVRLR